MNFQALKRKLNEPRQAFAPANETLLIKAVPTQTSEEKPPLIEIEDDLAAGKNMEHFERVYEGAGLTSRKFSVTSLTKLARNSKYLVSQPASVKSTAILVALEAVNTTVEEVMEDAFQRERALDAYEEIQRQALEDFEDRKAKVNSQLQAELEAKVAEISVKIQANQSLVNHARSTFAKWQTLKRQEIDRLRETVELCRLPISGEGAEEANLNVIKPVRRFAQKAE